MEHLTVTGSLHVGCQPTSFKPQPTKQTQRQNGPCAELPSLAVMKEITFTLLFMYLFDLSDYTHDKNTFNQYCIYILTLCL